MYTIIISDQMSLLEIMETSFEHIQATGDLPTYLEELKRAPTKETVVPSETSEGWLGVISVSV